MIKPFSPSRKYTKAVLFVVTYCFASTLSLNAQDQILQDVISGNPLPEITSTKRVFYEIMSCIIGQQIHYRSTKKLFLELLNKAALPYLSLENFSVFEQKTLAQTKLKKPTTYSLKVHI